jgi:Domain of unknown function (DUF4148)
LIARIDRVCIADRSTGSFFNEKEIDMNIKKMILILVSIAATGSVLAQAPTTGKTRAEVLRELEQARAAGQMSVPDAQYPRLVAADSRGGIAAPSAAITDCKTHQQIDPIYSGA